MQSDDQGRPSTSLTKSDGEASGSTVSNLTGWDPSSGPPGWVRGYQSAATADGPRPPKYPIQQTRGLSPFGMPARHALEIPLLTVIVVLTALFFVFGLLMTLVGWIPLQLSAPLLLAPLILVLQRGLLYAQLRTGGIKITATQFPDAYRMVVEAAARFGMAKTPDAYVVLGNGAINAFASGHGFRRFVAVNSDLFEIGGAARDPDALAFIIGHEVGHIAAGHTSYWRWLGMYVVPYLPILGGSLQRAQEYTADNHGYCYNHEGAPGAMRTLAGGKYLNALVGFDEMADRAPVERGFFVWLYNGLVSHPVLTWRMWALRDRSKHGNLLWRPNPPVAPLPSSGFPPPGGGYPPYGRYQPQAGGGYPQQPGGYAHSTDPYTTGGYPQPSGGYPQPAGGYPPQSGGYPSPRDEHRQPTGGYPQQPSGYPQPTDPYPTGGYQQQPTEHQGWGRPNPGEGHPPYPSPDPQDTTPPQS